MLTLIILFLGYSGTFVFALSGVRLFDWNKPKAEWKAFITAFLSSFGGGLTRDLLVLHCSPAILNAPIDLCILVISCLCYALLHAAHKASILNHVFIKKSITLFDGAGTAVFVCMGVDTAIRCGAPWIVALLCGIITAIGGGIWAAIIFGKCLQIVLRSASCYRTIVAIHATIYSILKYSTLHIEDSVVMVLIISCTMLHYLLLHTRTLNHGQKHRWTKCKSPKN